MSKLRPVEEVANYFRGGANIARARMMIREDRHAIHTLLRESGERKKLPDLGNNSDFHNGYNLALDDILTLIDELFSDRSN